MPVPTPPKGYALDTPTPPPPPSGYSVDGADISAPDYKETPAQTAARLPFPEHQGFFSSFADASGLSGLTSAIAHPLDTAKAVWNATSDDNIKAGIANKAAQLKQINQEALSGQHGAALTHAALAVPVLGPAMQSAADSVMNAPGGRTGQSYLSDLKQTLTNPGAMGTLTGTAAGLVAPDAIANGVTGGVSRLARNVITAGSDLDAPILGTSTTPRARYQAAQRTGVNLDLADATNAPIPRMAKAINQDSLFGSHVYENAKVANRAALTGAADDAVNAMSPLDRQTGGAALQDLYKGNQNQLLQASRDGHGYIQANYGDTPIGPTNASKLFGVAGDIQSEQATHSAQFPSLVPGKVSAIVNDASKFGKPDAPFAPDSTVGQVTTPPTQPYVSPTVSDALKARSGILDVYQNNPEIVKSSADAQLQRLVGGVHDSVMDSLPADAQKTLRDAQLSFKEAKQVYDDPSSPLYHAVRTPNPESLVTGPSSQTPSALASILPRVGDTGQGIIQRGVAEKALGEAPGGGYNFQTFPRKLSTIPDDYASALYGPKLSTLQDISDTSQAISKDLNPSGTAKQGQKLAEMYAMLPTLGAPAMQYPLARAMNSPKLVDMVMRSPTAATSQGFGIPAKPFLLPRTLKSHTKTGTE